MQKYSDQKYFFGLLVIALIILWTNYGFQNSNESTMGLQREKMVDLEDLRRIIREEIRSERKPFDDVSFEIVSADNSEDEKLEIKVEKKLETRLENSTNVFDGNVWEFKSSSYLSGYPTSLSNQVLSFDSFSVAAATCLQVTDCGGVTKMIKSGKFEIRKEQTFEISTEEDSWRKKNHPAVLATGTDCESQIPSLQSDVTVMSKYKNGASMKKYRTCDADGQFEYGAKYDHMNQIIRFSSKIDYLKLIEPAECPPKSGLNSTMILFGIKSMPSRHAQRQAIRETWMNKTFWEFEENLDMHLIFLLGKDGTEISEEEKIYNDILMIDFNESHYNLSVKDYSLFSYIDEHCKNIDYLFKGDDDILLVPENAIYHLNMLKNHPTATMTGCLKSGQPTNRIFESKYFTPIEFYEPALLPNYFAGAGYFMNRETLQKLIKIKEQVPIIHLDDVYIGKLIKAADLQDTMLQAVNFCTGVHAFAVALFGKTANNGWKLSDGPTEPCLMGGLTVFHRFAQGPEMKKVFLDFKNADVSERCSAAKIKTISDRWHTKDIQFIGVNYKAVINSYLQMLEHYRKMEEIIIEKRRRK